MGKSSAKSKRKGGEKPSSSSSSSGRSRGGAGGSAGRRERAENEASFDGAALEYAHQEYVGDVIVVADPFYEEARGSQEAPVESAAEAKKPSGSRTSRRRESGMGASSGQAAAPPPPPPAKTRVAKRDSRSPTEGPKGTSHRHQSHQSGSSADGTPVRERSLFDPPFEERHEPRRKRTPPKFRLD